MLDVKTLESQHLSFLAAYYGYTKFVYGSNLPYASAWKQKRAKRWFYKQYATSIDKMPETVRQYFAPDTDEYVACGLTANSGLVPRETIAQISYDMSIYEVVELIGFAGEDIGSGTVVHVYQLEDGNEVRIGYRLGEGGILRVASVREVTV